MIATFKSPSGLALPLELVQHVITILRSDEQLETLGELAACNKAFYSIITPQMYESLTITKRVITKLFGRLVDKKISAGQLADMVFYISNYPTFSASRPPRPRSSASSSSSTSTSSSSSSSCPSIAPSPFTMTSSSSASSSSLADPTWIPWGNRNPFTPIWPNHYSKAETRIYRLLRLLELVETVHIPILPIKSKSKYCTTIQDLQGMLGNHRSYLVLLPRVQRIRVTSLDKPVAIGGGYDWGIHSEGTLRVVGYMSKPRYICFHLKYDGLGEWPMRGILPFFDLSDARAGMTTPVRIKDVVIHQAYSSSSYMPRAYPYPIRISFQANECDRYQTYMDDNLHNDERDCILGQVDAITYLLRRRVCKQRHGLEGSEPLRIVLGKHKRRSLPENELAQIKQRLREGIRRYAERWKGTMTSEESFEEELKDIKSYTVFVMGDEARDEPCCQSRYDDGMRDMVTLLRRLDVRGDDRCYN